MSILNIADRIQHLRKAQGLSQEELADRIGVSRQAVSKWESEQSTPDIEKIILLSECFAVSTDYLLKGIERAPQAVEKTPDARLFALIGTVFNFIGLVTAIMVWFEKQNAVAVAVGLILMAVGCMVFSIGQYFGKNSEVAFSGFWLVNIWLLALIPISCVFNLVQGILIGSMWPIATPLPFLWNSIAVYVLCWLVYIGVCVSMDMLIICKKRKAENQ